MKKKWYLDICLGQQAAVVYRSYETAGRTVEPRRRHRVPVKNQTCFVCFLDLSYCWLMHHFAHLLTTCTTLCYSGLRPHPRLAPRAAAHPAQSEETIIVEDTKTMFYVDVESAAVSVVIPTNARHHKMCVRVTIDCVPEKEIF